MQTFTFELFEGTFKSHDQVNENLQYILAYIAIIQHQIRKSNVLLYRRECQTYR